MVEIDLYVATVEVSLVIEQMYLYRIAVVVVDGGPFAEIQHSMVTCSIVGMHL